MTLKSSSGGSFAKLSSHSSGTREGLLQFATIPNLAAISIMMLFLIVIIGFASVRIAKNTGCLPPPYIYVSYSDEHNLLSITRDGCTMTTRVLSAPALAHEHLDMRSMVMGTYQNKTALFVANAGHVESSVLVFQDCSYWNGQRSFITRVMSEAQAIYRDAAQHAYGIAFDREGNIYVSYQHTNVVLRGSRDVFAPMASPAQGAGFSHLATLPAATTSLSSRSSPSAPSPPPSGSVTGRGQQRARPPYPRMLRSQRKLTDAYAPSSLPAAYLRQPQHENKTRAPAPAVPVDSRTNTTARRFPGTFVQFGDPGAHNYTDQGVRSIVWVLDNLWIANEDADQVFIINRAGQTVFALDVKAPIGIFYLAAKHLVFVGSKSHHHGGVWAYRDSTFDLERSFVLQNMRHPTGIVAYEDTLFVADQSIDSIITFSVSTGRYLT